MTDNGEKVTKLFADARASEIVGGRYSAADLLEAVAGTNRYGHPPEVSITDFAAAVCNAVERFEERNGVPESRDEFEFFLEEFERCRRLKKERVTFMFEPRSED